ncbi:MAG: manganese efflux pump [Candidatus Omnitrophota bacterium]|nr:MAG: manganese efflux pump [Candidatus Omnitrophota bacterium]
MEATFLSNLWYILAIAVALGTDAFSVALGVGSGKRYKGQKFRLGFHFGLFQGLMPLIGWCIGSIAVEWVHQWDHWLASSVLFVVALHTFYEAIWPETMERERDLSRGWFLVSLSVATSIDALAVGLVFGVLAISPILPALLIGLVAGGMTLTGLFLGRYLRACYGRIVGVLGGVLLLFVSFKFLAI